MNMILLLIGFVGLLAVGAPIVVAMGLPAIIYYIVSGTSLSLVAYSFYQSTMSFSLLAVPAFILMGNLVSELGETARAFDFARALAKGKRGYSSRIAVVLSLIFAGMSGAAIAGVCGLGPIFVDSMEEEGYERDYGAALTIAASTVGPIFPPSIPLVLYATIAQISSVKSLLGGVGPGILMSAMLLFYVLLVDKKKLVNPPMAKAMMKEERSIRELFFRALPIAIAPLLILITMLSGIFSPGETGGMAVLYMLLLGICHRSLTWSGFWRCVKETCKSVSSIMVIMTAGGIFTKALMLENLPAKIIALLGPVANIPLAVILIVNIILLIMGMFMESNCALILTAPIVLQITQGVSSIMVIMTAGGIRNGPGLYRRHDGYEPDDRAEHASLRTMYICGLAGCQRAFGEGYQVGGADVHTAGNCADTHFPDSGCFDFCTEYDYESSGRGMTEKRCRILHDCVHAVTNMKRIKYKINEI